jgi:DNA-binding beta-propeller fold protein YncE
MTVGMKFSCGPRPIWMAGLGLLLVNAAPLSAADATPEKSFKRIATYLVCENTTCERDEDADELELTVVEVLAATRDGNTIAYTDSEADLLGFVDITDPAAPQGLGTTDSGGAPDGIAIADGGKTIEGGPYVLLTVNTTEEDFDNPSGFLAVYDIEECLATIAGGEECEPVEEFDLGGQPAKLQVSPDVRFAAIPVTNERDEEEIVDGVEGGLPQFPPGFLQIVDLVGEPSEWTLRRVELTGIADVFSEDPEPEFAAINPQNRAAISLQENNHVVVVDLPSGQIFDEFSVGSAKIENLDTESNRVIELVDDLKAVREPDDIAWLGNRWIVTANEGDFVGGTRNFTIWNRSGKIRFDAGNEIEHAAARAGHYPEASSSSRGAEVETVEAGEYDGQSFVFAGLERGNLVPVYVDGLEPKLVQVLPVGIAPGDLLAIPSRNLLLAAAEIDEDVRSQINVFELQEGPPDYPTVVSTDDPTLEEGQPIGWGALSALAADKVDPDILYTVHDGFYDQSRIYVVDVGVTPAEIFDQIVLMKNGKTVDYDLEGIARREGGKGFWLVSEGSGSVDDPEDEVASKNLLVRTDGGTILKEIKLPRATNRLQREGGFQGVASDGTGKKEQVYIAFQREWVGDPEGLVRIGRYTPATDEWAYFYYPLDEAELPEDGWVGLSEIAQLEDGTLWVIERDNQGGPAARIKRLYALSIDGITPAPEGGDFPILEKELVVDLLPLLRSTNGWTLDKPEGLAVSADGEVYVVTDNNGVARVEVFTDELGVEDFEGENVTGETRFFRLGPAWGLGASIEVAANHAQ